MHAYSESALSQIPSDEAKRRRKYECWNEDFPAKKRFKHARESLVKNNEVLGNGAVVERCSLVRIDSHKWTFTEHQSKWKWKLTQKPFMRSFFKNCIIFNFCHSSKWSSKSLKKTSTPFSFWKTFWWRLKRSIVKFTKKSFNPSSERRTP